jgi:beta-lactamase class D/2-keto-3-deoxy-L-rhamnonate aldolase RhmA
MLPLALVLIMESTGAAVPPPAVAAGECVVLAPVGGGVETAFGGEECDRRTLPASTFKIPHALIALDAGVVTDKTMMKWDGRKKDFPTWERDHTLHSAIASSVVWFFQKAADSIGREREVQHLRAFAYGSQAFTGSVDSFWLNGDLTISPREQIAFLRRMFTYDLPVDRRHIDAVKAAMTMPPGTLSNASGTHEFPLKWPAGTVARLKTGNGTVSGDRVSWLIGALDVAGREYVFASRVRSSTRPLETTSGADLAVRILNAMAPQARATHTNAIIDLWAEGKPAFGVYAPNENAGPRGQSPRPAIYTREGGEKLAMNPLYDFVFLNLEGSYDAAAVKAMAEGLRSPRAVGRKTLIVRIPPIDKDGAAVARARVKEVLELGGGGVTIPHVRNIDEAKEAIGFFHDAKASVWSPSNPSGETIAMLMLEDPAAVAQARAIADLEGYSVLACGIGSLAQALGGDRAGAEAGTQKVLAEAKRAKLADMLTANPQDVAQRVQEGFLALLMQGPTADDAIRIGRAAAGR